MAKDLSLSVTLKAINKATGPLKKITQGSRGVGRAMRETRDEMRDLQAQQQKITAFRDMSRKAHGSRRALMGQREELRQITNQLKNTTGPTKRLTQQQAKAQAAVDKLSSEYKEQRTAVKGLSRQLPKAAKGTKGLKAQSDALEDQIRKTNERLNAQRAALGRLADADVGGRFRQMGGEMRKFGRNVAVASTAAAGGIFALAKSTADLGDDVGKTASSIGVTNAELQELRYAAERSGVPTEKLDSNMQAFTKRLGEAADGSGTAADAYEKLGLDAERLADIPVSQAMAEVADKMKDIESPTRRNAIAADLFSRSGIAMVNMLKDGSEGLKGYADDARRTGYLLGDKAVEDSEAFQDTLLDTQLSFAGLKNIIGAELLPVVGEFMGKLTGWLAENRDEVKEFAKAFGQNLKDAVPVIKELATGAASFVKAVAGMAKAAADALGGYDKLAIVLGGLFASKLIASVVSFGVGIGKAAGAMGAFAKTLPIVSTAMKGVGAAMAATPIGWIIGGIAAVAGAAYLIYKHWEPIKAFLGNLWDTVVDLAQAAWEVIKKVFSWSPLGLVARGWSKLSDAVGGPVNAAKAIAGKAWDVIKTIFKWSPLGLVARVWSGIAKKVGNPVNAAKGAASRAWDGIKAVFSWSPLETISRLWSGLKNKLAAPVEKAKDKLTGAWDAIREAFDGGIGDVAKLLINWSPYGMLWGAISTALEKLGIDVPESFSGMGGWIIDGIKNGITGKLGDLKDSITGVADKTAGWFKDKLGISSPSRVFAEYGGFTIDGLNKGLDDQRDEPARRVRDIARRVGMAGAGMAVGGAAIAGPAPPGVPSMPGVDAGGSIAVDSRSAMPSPAAAGGGDNGVTVNGGISINITAAPGMDEQALAREVNTQVQRALNQASRKSAASRRRNLYDND